jgi:hypothetical protein
MKTTFLTLLLFAGMVTFAQHKTHSESTSSSASVITESDDHAKSSCQSRTQNGESFSSFSCNGVRKDGFFASSAQKGLLVFISDALPEQGSIKLMPVLANKTLTTANFSFQSNRTDRCLTYALRVVPGQYQYQLEIDGHLQAPVILQVNAAEEKEIIIHPSL